MKAAIAMAANIVMTNKARRNDMPKRDLKEEWRGFGDERSSIKCWLGRDRNGIFRMMISVRRYVLGVP